MERETFPLCVERFDFLRWFDGYVISGLEGVVKPDRKIFELLITRFDLVPSRTLFVDDSAVNVDAAIAAGLRAVQFVSPSELITHLQGFGLL